VKNLMCALPAIADDIYGKTWAEATVGNLIVNNEENWSMFKSHCMDSWDTIEEFALRNTDDAIEAGLCVDDRKLPVPRTMLLLDEAPSLLQQAIASKRL